MKQIAVIGASDPDKATVSLAYEVGALIAKSRAVVVCGGLGGVMEAVCKGAKDNGGLTVGILPQLDAKSANSYVDVVICTGMGYARNALVAYSGDLVIALPGSYGTLSEIAFALSVGKRVLSLGSWDICGVEKIRSFEMLEKRIKDFYNHSEL